MKNAVGIVGSRNYPVLEKVDRYVDQLPEGVAVVSGGARGVDRRAEKHAQECGLHVWSYRVIEDPERGLFYCSIYLDDVLHNAVYKGRIHGSFASAAYARNGYIVDASDRIMAFWDGVSNGTRSTIDYAREHGVPYILVPPSEDSGEGDG